MKIEFEKLRFKNFMSYGNVWTEVDLNTHRATLIKGKNGEGKSSIIEALAFVLFNKSYTNKNKPTLVNDITNKACVVEVEFSIGSTKYKIVRSIKPNAFEVYANGELVNKENDSYQEVLEKQIIRCNLKSFCQVVILGSRSYVPYTELKAQDRKTVNEDLLDLGSYSIMQSLLKERIKEHKQQLSDLKRDEESVSRTLDVAKRSLAELRRNNDEVIEDYQHTIDEHRNEISTMRYKIVDLEQEIEATDGDIEALKNAKTKKREFELLKQDIINRHKQVTKDIEFLQTHDDCPVCKQAIESDFKDGMIAKKSNTVKKYVTTIEDVDQTISKLEETISKLNAIAELRTTKEIEVRSVRAEIKNRTTTVEKLEQKIYDLRNKSSSFDEREIESLSQQIAEKRNQQEQAQSSLEHYDAALKMVPLIKAQTIKKFVPLFNEEIKKYLNLFDFPIRYEIDEQFEETMMIRGKTDKGYESLSDGQKYRVNMALLFAWRAVARRRNSINCNLMFLDEILDSSLDDDGKQAFMDVLTKFSDGMNVFVISHAAEEVDGFDRYINVSRRGNFSQLEVIQ